MTRAAHDSMLRLSTHHFHDDVAVVVVDAAVVPLYANGGCVLLHIAAFPWHVPVSSAYGEAGETVWVSLMMMLLLFPLLLVLVWMVVTTLIVLCCL
jgi:hypothetical protein